MNFGDAKEQIRQKVDIVDLVGSSISLKRSGRGYVGLCPWHDDSKPSLQVNPDRQTWKCWVCDIGGDIFSFAMKARRPRLRGSPQDAGRASGHQCSTRATENGLEPGSPDDKNTLFQCCEWAAKQFHEYLLRSEAAEVARSYIEERAITPAERGEIQNRLCSGAVDILTDRAKTTPYSSSRSRCLRLAQSRTKRKAALRPLPRTCDVSHSRCARPAPSLLAAESCRNSPSEMPPSTSTRRKRSCFPRASSFTPSTLPATRCRRAAASPSWKGIPTSSCAISIGVDDVVAVLGTALTERHIPLLRRFADTVNLVLDGDEAGQRRTNDILEIFVSGNMDLRILDSSRRV